MSKFTLVFTLLLASTQILFAQKSDSLKGELSKFDKKDQSYVQLMIDIAEQEFKVNTDSFYHYSKGALQISNRLHFDLGISKSSANLGFYFRTAGSFDSAIFYYEIAILNESDPQHLPKLYYQMGNSYSAKGDLTKAYEMYLNSLQLSEKNNNNLGKALAYLGIAHTYQVQKELANALANNLKALEIFKMLGDERGIYIVSNNCGGVYTDRGEYDSASIYFHDALKLAKKFGDRRGSGDIYSNLGVISEKFGDLDSSIYYHSEAIKIRRHYKLQHGLIKSYHNLASAYIHKRNLTMADAFLDSAFLLNQELNSTEESKFYWNYKFQLDTARGQYREAIHDIIEYQKNKEELEALEVKNKLAELQTQYETEKKDNEIASLSQQAQIQALEIKQRNLMLAGLGVVLLLLIGGGVFYYQWRNLRYQQSVAGMEQRMLRLQMNPHFIFNALAAIQSYIIQSNTRESISYLAKFGKLMRQILEHSREEFVTINEEADMLRNYLEIQQLRFNNSFEFDINIDENIDANSTHIPPMFAQPFVENAIEHGLSGKNADGHVSVHFLPHGKNIKVMVEDNGEGLRVSSGVSNKQHKSLATQITKERLQLLSKQLHDVFELEVQNREGAVGTVTQLIIPSI